ncbi:acyl carrier protein [Streptomyces viridochromogenes]|uniref:acyl carrier protein n=1 Tax=Streptomyces viridochromogenes TaxID=1938 RepID=UPI00068FAD31|nr:phosphopantetheine-binding protein [Streptomyces viridochromogenes]
MASETLVHSADPVDQHLVTVLQGKFEVAPEDIRPEATLEDLGLDSLAAVELYVTLQEQWQVPLDDSEANIGLTVQQVRDTVHRLRADSAGEGGTA